MFICYKTSTLNISKQRFWEHILRRDAILEDEQTQGSIPMIFLNNYIYPSEPLDQIWTFRKTLVIIRGLSYGIRELHDRTLKDHTGNNRSKSWFSVWWLRSTETFDEFKIQFTYVERTVSENSYTGVWMIF